ncbi:MAG: NlpC/P60 family protein [Clostridiales bacterium]|nr:NlpC/P60 family protein [Clostridiales bacterium]
MRNRRVREKCISAVLVAAMAVALVFGADPVRTVYATTDDDDMSAEDIRDQAQEDLEKTNQEIEEIESNQQEVAADLDVAAEDLNALVAKMDQLQIDIADKQAEVEEAAAELVVAQQDESDQYDAMKLRIQYMYENSVDNSLWKAIIESNGLADMLNRIEYVSDLYQSDRDMMDTYKAAVQKVEDWQVQLASDMDALMALQSEYEAQETELQAKISQLKDQQDKYATQLANAQAAAQSYQDTITEQERIIQEQEAAAAALAAEEAASYQGGGTGESGLGDADYLSDASYDPDFQTDVTGEELVAYALQFVGNPYRWGGNSLTEGCDCSGFVHLIYAHFGISTPRYSQSFKTVGEPVAYENMKAGDVVVYPGHVAIYIGNGCIVEAQSTVAGITCNRSVNCHTITAIRRLL